MEQSATNNSKIINLIKTNSDWKKVLEDKKIKVKIEDDNLAIFNYDVGADFTDPIVREARGIILDINEMRVVCWPFTKFCNANEEAAKVDLESFDWNCCRVEEKIDGSICKLYWKPYRGVMADDLGIKGWWAWATNSCIDAFDANLQNSHYKNFGELIELAINFSDIKFEDLNKDYTYIFELVGPENRVVVDYPCTKLYHIGTRNNITGEEYHINIGVDQPRLFIIHSLQSCINFAEHLNDGCNKVSWEGFVAVDKEWHRVKIKSPEYLKMHYMIGNGNYSKERILNLLKDMDIHDFDECGLEIAAIARYYFFRLKDLEYNIDRYIRYVRGLYEEYGYDRKAVALEIKFDKLAPFGFKALGNNKTAKDLLDDTRDKVIADLIPYYVRKNILSRY